MKKKSLLLLALILAIFLTACGNNQTQKSSGKLNVVATNSMIKDLAVNIGGDKVQVETLVPEGMDLHTYEASPKDIEKLQNADIIIYNGLGLEGKLEKVIENLNMKDKIVVEIGSNIVEESSLISVGENEYDPHIWFDIGIWKEAAGMARTVMGDFDSENKENYERNYNEYIEELERLDGYIRERIEELPEDKRILITSHDAFRYFGKAYDFETRGLQDISTSSEPATSDVSNMANYIVDNKVKSIFTEASVSDKSMKALIEAVESKGFTVNLADELYSESLLTGEKNTYIDTYRYNIDNIVDGLK